MSAPIKLFDIINIMFTKPSEYEKLKNIDKSRNVFMINRFFSIKYPTTANSLNFNGINSVAVVDLWQLVAKRNIRVPGWIYTKTKNNKSTKKQWEPDKELARFYMDKFQINECDLNNMIKYNENEVKKIFKNLEKQTKMM